MVNRRYKKHVTEAQFEICHLIANLSTLMTITKELEYRLKIGYLKNYDNIVLNNKREVKIQHTLSVEVCITSATYRMFGTIY